jgi:WD40 repeat protein
VTSATFTGGVGSQVVTSSADGTIRLWDAVFQPELEKVADVGAPVASIAFGDDGRLRVGTTDRRVHVIDPASGDEISVAPGIIWARRVVADDGSVATIRGRTVILRARGHRTVLEGHRDRVTSVAFSHAGGRLASASRDHDVRIWNVATGNGVDVFQHNTAVRDAEFSPDGRWLVSAASKAGLWDLGSGEILLRLRGHEGTTTAVTFDPSGTVIVTGGVDGTVRSYTCEVCGGIDELLALARSRLAGTQRELTPEEREQYLR